MNWLAVWQMDFKGKALTHPNLKARTQNKGLSRLIFWNGQDSLILREKPQPVAVVTEAEWDNLILSSLPPPSLNSISVREILANRPGKGMLRESRNSKHIYLRFILASEPFQLLLDSFICTCFRICHLYYFYKCLFRYSYQTGQVQTPTDS